MTNPGTALNLDWLEDVRVNASAVSRRTQSLTGRRNVKGPWQTAWLLHAIQCMDLTTLSSDDTPKRVQRLCAKARQPIRPELVKSLGIESLNLQVGAVCVYHAFVNTAVTALKNTNIPVAAVAAGFPHGLSPISAKLNEIRASVEEGAQEIDIVISRHHVLTGNWTALYDEVAAFKEACGEAHLKTILGTGDLGTFRNVAKASWVCLMAGADFIKTSTGKEAVNATLPVTLVMLRVLREYHQRTGHWAGFKPAGGIRTAKQALDWLVLVREELGFDAQQPARFRFGASGLLTDIERQLEHRVTGRYATAARQPLC
ncbi:MAG: deoxyribose-phosphate aldolase [SAR324 cluster bacterium]|nr:deoxyribose-phosphate aldolase [SAR324 cluster bacterium]